MIATLAFPIISVQIREIRILRHFDRHATIAIAFIATFTLPTGLIGGIQKIGILRELYGNARRPVPSKAPLAFPSDPVWFCLSIDWHFFRDFLDI